MALVNNWLIRYNYYILYSVSAHEQHVECADDTFHTKVRTRLSPDYTREHEKTRMGSVHDFSRCSVGIVDSDCKLGVALGAGAYHIY